MEVVFGVLKRLLKMLRVLVQLLAVFQEERLKILLYREVVSGRTNHAEVCQITYDSKIISLKNILELFFLIHDPTTINRQGNDIGRHYRSIILYHYDDEMDLIKIEIERFNKEYYDNGIVTEIKKSKHFI